MEVMIVGFIIWIIFSITVIISSTILVLTNKTKGGTIILGSWVAITFILFIIMLITSIK